MLENFANRIANALCESNLICNDDREIYQFGIEIALLKCIHVITMLIIGAVFGLFFESVIFIVCYSILRDYAGGYHAKTKVGCYVISWVMIILVIIVVKNCPAIAISKVSALGLLLSAIIIFILAPEDNPNKPLDQTEVKRYRNRARLLVIIEILLAALLWAISINSILLIITLSQMSVSIMLILRKVQLSLGGDAS